MVVQARWKMCWHVEEGEQGLGLVAIEDGEDEVAVQNSDHGQASDEVEGRVEAEAGDEVERVEAVWVVGEGLPGELAAVPDCLVFDSDEIWTPLLSKMALKVFMVGLRNDLDLAAMGA
jgi:hypothetical protein